MYPVPRNGSFCASGDLSLNGPATVLNNNHGVEASVVISETLEHFTRVIISMSAKVAELENKAKIAELESKVTEMENKIRKTKAKSSKKKRSPVAKPAYRESA
ncbi:MAG TPA: hypothetical protein VHO03_16465 [Ignavibacteriales bacterium]|nr:hypothetical protein [Ignavibacteriales bacterium]